MGIFLGTKIYDSCWGILNQQRVKIILKIKRIYEPFSIEDGTRILVERLWPRGFSKESAHIDIWMKDIAPSTELRKWFNHEDEKWERFQEEYKKELKNNPLFLELEKIVQEKRNVTLIYSSKNLEHNSAVVLYNLLR